MKTCLAVIVILLQGGTALAFHETDSFERSANSGGGSGFFYTGSPRFKGYECSLCHEDGEDRISIELGGNLVGGSYEPGLVYRIEIKLLGEHRGLQSAFNPNTFTADITDDAGQPIGTFSAGFGNVVRIMDEGRVAVAEGFGEGEDQWSFSWAAPVDAVPARLYVALLDGDGAYDPADPERRSIDPLNDDVATLRFDLCPAGMQCGPPPTPAEETSPAGCSSGGNPGAAALLLLLGLLLVTRARVLRHG